MSLVMESILKEQRVSTRRGGPKEMARCLEDACDKMLGKGVGQDQRGNWDGSSRVGLSLGAATESG